jgi:outer membrane protein assembly factor BamB
VAGEHIYTIGDGPDASFVHALNRNDGKPRWAAKLGKAGELGGYAGPRSTPTVDGDYVFALGQFGDLVCFDRKDGKELWRRNYVSDFGVRSLIGLCRSVLVDGDNVIGTPGGVREEQLLRFRKNRKGSLALQGVQGSGAVRIPYRRQNRRCQRSIQLTASSVAVLRPKMRKLLWAEREGMWR